MFLTVVIVCMIIGALVGFLAGLLGIGGGLIIVPALVILLPLLGIDAEIVMPIALATSLCSIVFTSFVASVSHSRNKNIPWTMSRNLAVFISIGAISGGFIADVLSAKLLTLFFSTAVILLASYMIASLKFIRPAGPHPSLGALRFIGAVTGVVASLMGISGGAILIPVLTFCHVQMRHAIGISSVCGFFVAVFGTAGFVVAGLDQPMLPDWCLGYVYLPALLGFILTSSIFAPVGVKLASQLPVDTIKKLFAGFLILIAIEMVIN